MLVENLNGELLQASPAPSTTEEEPPVWVRIAFLGDVRLMSPEVVEDELVVVLVEVPLPVSAWSSVISPSSEETTSSSSWPWSSSSSSSSEDSPVKGTERIWLAR